MDQFLWILLVPLIDEITHPKQSMKHSLNLFITQLMKSMKLMPPSTCKKKCQSTKGKLLIPHAVVLKILEKKINLIAEFKIFGKMFVHVLKIFYCVYVIYFLG